MKPGTLEHGLDGQMMTMKETGFLLSILLSHWAKNIFNLGDQENQMERQMKTVLLWLHWNLLQESTGVCMEIPERKTGALQSEQGSL